MLVVFSKQIIAILLQRKRRIARMHLVVVFCKHILAILLQKTTSDDHQCFNACWLCFLSPSLQYFYKTQHQTIIMHLECLLCFVSPSLQRKHQTIINASCLFAIGRLRRIGRSHHDPDSRRAFWNKRSDVSPLAGSTFQGCEYTIWALISENLWLRGIKWCKSF